MMSESSLRDGETKALFSSEREIGSFFSTLAAPDQREKFLVRCVAQYEQLAACRAPPNEVVGV